ncbi:MAG: hypothetical protein LWX07_12985 [Bacteroidetes bacterium]|nr:hypothetical protein [Bacteroidota bacterium]
MELKRFSISDDDGRSEQPGIVPEQNPVPRGDDDIPDIPLDADYDIEKLQKLYPEENDDAEDKEEAEMREYKKKLSEQRLEDEKQMEKERRRSFNYMKVEEIDRSNPDVNDFVSNTLVPGLIDFTKSKNCRCTLIRLFHDLGCSASFVFALAGVFHDVAHALQMAVESFEDKIIILHQDDVAKAERIIVCYRKMFNKFDRSTIFAFNKEDKWHEHHEPLNFISFISPFKFQRTYERQT